MPMYDWKCDECEHELNDMLMKTEDPAPTCGNCGATMRKVIGRTQFRLKGAGWYETDGKTGDSRRNLHEYGFGSRHRDE